MKYRAREGSRLSNKMANFVGLEVEKIEAGGWEVTPRLLLERATKKSHPLHSCFEWDESRAAHEHRVEQARNLLRSFIPVTRAKKQIREMRSVRVDKVERGYRRRKEIISDNDFMNQMSVDFHERLMGVVHDVEDLGLDKKDGAWRNICQTAHRVVPAAVQVNGKKKKSG